MTQAPMATEGDAGGSYRLAHPRIFAKRVRAVAEKEAAWMTSTPERIRAVAAGRLA